MTNPPALTLLTFEVAETVRQSLQALGWLVQVQAELDPSVAEDAVLVQADTAQALQALARRPGLSASALDSAWVVVTPVHDPLQETELLRLGVEAIVPPLDAAALARQLHHAVQRKRMERAARTAYATDLATGLPHQAQLVEHMTQLLALREREPAPMLLLVLRVEGLAAAAERLGAESANVLRRKVAVRLRSGLRASDVVAAIGEDGFGVLLGRLEKKSDADGVAGKLVRALQQPFSIAGEPCSVSVTVGMALYPEHGKQADALLKRASAQAASVASLGAEGFASRVQRIGAPAANDDAP
jgi:diguanylate cyclase (GGDEF)-like protein